MEPGWAWKGGGNQPRHRQHERNREDQEEDVKDQTRIFQSHFDFDI